MGDKSKRFLIAILRFHGDVLLTTPMISEIKRIFPDSIIDLLVYKGTGSILEFDKRVNSILEAELSSEVNIIKRTFKEILLLKRSKQNLKRNVLKSAQRALSRTAVKAVGLAIDAKDKKTASEAFNKAQKVLDTMANKKVIHANKAARIKSRLNKKIKSL